MVENKYLIEWISETYPMMRINEESDLLELCYVDFELFADWLFKKLKSET